MISWLEVVCVATHSSLLQMHSLHCQAQLVMLQLLYITIATQKTSSMTIRFLQMSNTGNITSLQIFTFFVEPLVLCHSKGVSICTMRCQLRSVTQNIFWPLLSCIIVHNPPAWCMHYRKSQPCETWQPPYHMHCSISFFFSILFDTLMC